MGVPEHAGTAGPADDGADAPRRVRLYVSLPVGLHHRVRTWAAWNCADVSRLVEDFLAKTVGDFEVREGRG